MLRSCWTNSIATIQGSRDNGGEGSILAFFSLSFFHSLIGYSPVQMASAQVLPPSDYSPVEVQFPNAPYPQDDIGICFLFVFFFAFFSVYADMQPRSSVAREGIM